MVRGPYRETMKIRSIGLVLLLTVGVFVLGVLLANFVVMPMFIHQRTTVIVPDVRSVSEQQARRALERVSLKLQVERSEFDAEKPEGFVISQRPRPNDTVKEGRTVSVVVSLGPKTQRVPDLKNLSLRQGRLMLTQQKLEPGRVARVLREGGAGDRETVLAFTPGAGREVEEGSEVDLLVGVDGRPRRYVMPSLDGQDLLFIREKLENRGFRIGRIRYESRSGVYPNTIIGQSPQPGVMIREGDSIELVAAGSE